MKITIIGAGYVGLVTGACLAEMGNFVICLDHDSVKIDLLIAGGIPIHEPGLDIIVKRNVSAGRLRFTNDKAVALCHGQVQFIAVGTPPGEDGSADLQYVLSVAKDIGSYMPEDFTVVVDKSTVPVGTADKVRSVIDAELLRRGVQRDFAVVSNPEFLKEGAAVDDFMRPDRIIIGVDSERALAVVQNLYEPFLRNHDRLISMDLRSAELTKYAANAMLATRISFMNEIALLAEELDADIELVRKGIGSDPRIGFSFLYAGAGYGGSCFPKDVKALIKTASDHGYQMSLLSAVERINERQKLVLSDKISRRFGSSLDGRCFGVWGLAFKPETDDVREAPSLVLIKYLLACGAVVQAYDPVAQHEAQKALGCHANLKFVSDAYSAATDADAIVIVTEWREFRTPDWSTLRQVMRSSVLFDGRNLFSPESARAQGFEYFPVGRGKHNS